MTRNRSGFRECPECGVVLPCHVHMQFNAPPERPTPSAPHPLACQNTECGHSRIAHGKYDRCTECACRHFESTPAAEGQE